jgi:hypothetical protein
MMIELFGKKLAFSSCPNKHKSVLLIHVNPNSSPYPSIRQYHDFVMTLQPVDFAGRWRVRSAPPVHVHPHSRFMQNQAPRYISFHFLRSLYWKILPFCTCTWRSTGVAVLVRIDLRRLRSSNSNPGGGGGGGGGGGPRIEDERALRQLPVNTRGR